MLKNIEKIIRDYLPQVIHLSLATCKDGKPWVCEVHFAYDADLNLYFMSKITTRHCREISNNKYVSGNIVVQHGINDKPRGVYFEGTAEVLEDLIHADSAYKVYLNRFPERRAKLPDVTGQEQFRLYKITVQKYYVFDARESVPSMKYELEWK